MATITSVVLHPPPDRFPPGTAVSAFRGSAWSGQDKSVAPTGAADVGPVAVAADGSLTFVGLTDQTTYFAYAASAGPPVRFATRHDYVDDLKSDVARRTPLATQGSAIDLLTLYLEDFAPSGVVGSGNDTVAMQAVLDYIVAKDIRNVEIRLPPVINLASQPRTDRGGNAIVALPQWLTTNDPARWIRFKGAPGDTHINVAPSGVHAYSATFGPPSAIGGPTTEQLGVNARFSNCNTIWDGIKFYMPSNSDVAALDLSRMGQVQIPRLVIFGNGGNTVQPTNVNAFGVWLPEGTNSARIDIGILDVQYMYAGIVGNSAHIRADSLILNYCVLGLGLTGNQQVNANDGHSSIITHLLTQECNYHLASYSPATGVISMPAGDAAQVRILLWDIEDWAGTYPGPWSATVQHVLDANNQIYGTVDYARVVAQTGKVTGALTRSGGKNLIARDLTLAGHGGTPGLAAGAGLGTAPGAVTAPAGFGTNTDKQGAIQFGSGTALPAFPARVVTVTFADAYTSIPRVVLEEMNAATKALGLYVAPAVGGFNVFAVTAPAVSQPASTFQFNYAVVEPLTT